MEISCWMSSISSSAASRSMILIATTRLLRWSMLQDGGGGGGGRGGRGERGEREKEDCGNDGETKRGRLIVKEGENLKEKVNSSSG